MLTCCVFVHFFFSFVFSHFILILITTNRSRNLIDAFVSLSRRTQKPNKCNQSVCWQLCFLCVIPKNRHEICMASINFCLLVPIKTVFCCITIFSIEIFAFDFLLAVNYIWLVAALRQNISNSEQTTNTKLIIVLWERLYTRRCTNNLKN